MQRRPFSPTLVTSLVFASLLVVAGQAQAQQPPPCCQLGDVDGDGELTNADLLLMQDHILDLECTDNACQADLNGDGEVSAADLLLLRKYFQGIIETFPRCGDLDGDGKLEWGSGEDDLNCFTSIFVGSIPSNCRYFSVADGNQDGILDNLDVFAFIDIANGNNSPVCSCYEPYVP